MSFSRRTWIAIAAGVVTLLAAIGAVAGTSDDPTPKIGSNASRRTTSSTSSTTTTLTATAPPPAAPSTTQAPTTAPTTLPTAPPSGKCVTIGPGEPRPTTRDWDQYWQTKPQPNDGISLTMCIDDITPRIGQVVTMRVIADDPDATIGSGPCDVIVEWDGSGAVCHDKVSETDPDPQPTPPEQPGHVDLSFQFTYQSAGPRIVYADVWSGPDDGRKPHPYHNTQEASLKVTVRTR